MHSQTADVGDNSYLIYRNRLIMKITKKVLSTCCLILLGVTSHLERSLLLSVLWTHPQLVYVPQLVQFLRNRTHSAADRFFHIVRQQLKSNNPFESLFNGFGGGDWRSSVELFCRAPRFWRVCMWCVNRHRQSNRVDVDDGRWKATTCDKLSLFNNPSLARARPVGVMESSVHVEQSGGKGWMSYFEAFNMD